MGKAPLVATVEGPCCAIDEIAAGRHAFLRRAWYAACGGEGLRTLVARRACGAPLLAIPTQPLHGFSALRTVPGSYWPFRSVGVGADSDVAELAEVLARPLARETLGQAWRLGPVYADDAAAAKVIAAARAAGWSVLTRGVGTSFALDLTAEWPSKSTRRRLAGYERRLAEVGGPVSVRHVRGADWSPTVLETLGAIEARSWVWRSTDRTGAKFGSAALRRRWATALADPVIADALSATILSVGEMPVAFSFDLTDGATQYAIATAYCERYAAFRPGRLVTLHQLRRAAANGVTLVDLGAGDSGYKQEMGATPHGRLVDHLFVRNRIAASIVAARWSDTPGAGPVPWLAAGLVTASAAFALID